MIWRAELLEHANKGLEALLTEADHKRLHAVPAVRVSGSVAATIVDYAKQAHVDVIVVGTHGRGAIGHFFLGSVAEHVARMAPCPVLVVRPNEHEFIVPDPVGVDARI
jgi:nucleotide-binding universal stress UspA family protein